MPEIGIPLPFFLSGQDFVEARDMRYKRSGFVILLAVALGLLLPAVALAQPPIPAFPAFYSGTVTMGGVPAPDGAEVFAKVKDYQSVSVTVADGSYANLKVAPPKPDVGEEVTFYVDSDGADGPWEPVVATTETVVTFEEWARTTVNLTTAELPPAGIPALPTMILWLGIGGAFTLGLGMLIWRRARVTVKDKA
jgi:hypothetical protein